MAHHNQIVWIIIVCIFPNTFWANPLIKTIKKNLFSILNNGNNALQQHQKNLKKAIQDKDTNLLIALLEKNNTITSPETSSQLFNIDDAGFLKSILSAASKQQKALIFTNRYRLTGEQLLHYHINKNHNAIVRELLCHNPLLATQDHRGFTPLSTATHKKNKEAFILLLDHFDTETIEQEATIGSVKKYFSYEFYQELKQTNLKQKTAENLALLINKCGVEFAVDKT